MRKFCFVIGAIIVGFWIIMALDLLVGFCWIFAPWLGMILATAFGIWMMVTLCRKPRR